jgi:hypothetical protein
MGSSILSVLFSAKAGVFNIAIEAISERVKVLDFMLFSLVYSNNIRGRKGSLINVR